MEFRDPNTPMVLVLNTRPGEVPTAAQDQLNKWFAAEAISARATAFAGYVEIRGALGVMGTIRDGLGIKDTPALARS